MGSKNILKLSEAESGRRLSLINFPTSPPVLSLVARHIEQDKTVEIEQEKMIPVGNIDDDDRFNSIKISKKDDDEFKRVFGTQGFDPHVMVNAPTPKPWDEWTIKGDFEIGKPLGRGLYGHVYLARTKVVKRIVALKIMHDKEIKHNKAEMIVNREVEIHSKLNHENIIKMFGFFRDNDKSVLVLEYAPGKDVFTDLNDQLNGRYTEIKAATYIDQVADGLQYLHENGIMHRDIKPENLLLGYFGEIKIADFGWAIKSQGIKESRMTICGTHEYMAPEILNNVPYDEKIDLWCLGVLVFEFLTGNTPFAVQCRVEMESRIKGVMLRVPFYVTYQGKDLIQKILCKEPSLRLSLKDIRSHAWIRTFKSREPKKLLPCFDQFKNLEPALMERYKDAGRILAEKRKQAKEANAGVSA